MNVPLLPSALPGPAARVLLAFALACPLLVPGDEDATLVARKGPIELSRAAYADWMLDRMGILYVRDFVGDVLVLDEAARRGLAPSPERVREAFDVEEASVIEHSHRGSRERYVSELQLRGYEYASWRAKREHELQVELSMLDLCRADRVVDEAAIERRFLEDFGPDGEVVSLEVLFYNAFREATQGGAEEVARLKQEAHDRAVAGREALLAGRPFDEVRAEADVPGSPFVVDGVIANWKRSLLGREFDAPVASLDEPGQASQVIDAWDGSWVVRLRDRHPVRLADVRDEVEQRVRAAEVTGEELAGLRARLMDGAEILLK